MAPKIGATTAGSVARQGGSPEVRGRQFEPEPNPIEPMPEASIHELDELPPDAAIAADHRNPRRRNREAQQEDEPEVGVLVHPEPRHELGGLILHRGVKQQILDGLRAIQIRDQLEEVWSISRLQPQQGRCILNFYGPPGTGKTRAALGVAHRLSQPLYQVDYSAVISKYLGDTAKHIKLAFERATHHGAVLFLDEADSLLSKRVSLDESCATSINQNRNCLVSVNKLAPWSESSGAGRFAGCPGSHPDE